MPRRKDLWNFISMIYSNHTVSTTFIKCKSDFVKVFLTGKIASEDTMFMNIINNTICTEYRSSPYNKWIVENIDKFEILPVYEETGFSKLRTHLSFTVRIRFKSYNIKELVDSIKYYLLYCSNTCDYIKLNYFDNNLLELKKNSIDFHESVEPPESIRENKTNFELFELFLNRYELKKKNFNKSGISIELSGQC